jgi:putative transposase
MSYATGCHTVFHHRYHIVWVTKYRYKVLKGTLRERIRTIIRQVCKELGVQIVSGVLSKEHVHMFVEIPPHIAVSDFVRRVKGRSSHRVQMEFPELRKRYSPFLGEGLLLHHQRQHHRRGDTSVSQVS